MHRLLKLVTVPVSFLAALCSPRDFSTDIVPDEAEAARRLSALATRPRTLARPLLLIHGWLDSPKRFRKLNAWIQKIFTNSASMVSLVPLDGKAPVGELGAKVAAAYGKTGEVDVVGHSMGGLVARSAAVEGLRVGRLFAIATPHRGALLARCAPAFLSRQLRDLGAGSEFIRALNADPASMHFEAVTYVVQGDTHVRKCNAEAIPGAHYYLRLTFWQNSHLEAPEDMRIIADVIEKLYEGP